LGRWRRKEDERELSINSNERERRREGSMNERVRESRKETESR